MLRTLFFGSALAAIGLTVISIVHPARLPAQPASAVPVAKVLPPALPLAHVVLFSSGVGYFQRQGEIDGNAKINLSFPFGDINDLIKSLVLEDTGGGKVVAVNYDSQDPIERTLRTFALDLTVNPSLGDLLNQARGEKVEVTLQSTGQSGTLRGSILGMESQRQPQGKEQVVDVDVLNLLTDEGLRSVPLGQVLRVRFANPRLDADLKQALEVIAGARDHQKKTVVLSLRGEGKRQIRVGYVLESPLWKTTYRLVLGADGKAQLQGWAVVENTTDNDWTDVKMALVSGRPISFKMDLYPPLYVPRPTIEPERFASLRPPSYGGAMTNLGAVGPLGALGAAGVGLGGAAGSAGGGGSGGQFQGAFGFAGGNNQTNLGFGGGNTNFGMPFNRYRLDAQLGMGAANTGFNNVNTQMDENENPARIAGQKLTFEEMKNRKEQALKSGQAIAMLDPSASVASVASAEEIGGICQYAIEDKVTLPRQKSAMLPIVQQAVEARKLSIYNESVHAKHPLSGVRFKNSAAQPLMQGPVTVYDGGGYAGDSRLADLQRGEERLLSYALDLGVEVKAEGRGDPDAIDAVKIVKGVLTVTHRNRQTRRYLIKNRSAQERTLLMEHPVRDTWNLVMAEKPVERSRDVYRFSVSVPAGQSKLFEVVEEQRNVNRAQIGQSDETSLRVLHKHSVPSAKFKAALDKLFAIKGRLTDVQRESALAQEQLSKIAEDQSRLRANFEKLPATSAAYKRYLEKFDAQESEIERLQATIKEKRAAEKAVRQELEEFVAGLNVEE